MDDSAPPVTPNPWQGLRRFTPARIALGRAGVSQPTGAQLAFQLAHASARDAVHEPLDAEAACRELASLGLTAVRLHSAAADRAAYLRRPDLGRRLDAASRERLVGLRRAGEDRRPYDLALVVADGLSARAIHRHARALLAETLARLPPDWRLSPAAVVEQARVAIGDEIGELLGADLVLVLIGERPGLSAPDSLGLYFTWAPRVGLTDAQRNCVSNVRPEGLCYREAAERLCHLLSEARRRRLTGVALKDDTDPAASALAGRSGNFLVEPVGR